MRILKITILAVALTATGLAAKADDYKLGDIMISGPWAFPKPAGAKTSAAFVTLKNMGSSPDRLVAASGDLAKRVELHTHAMKDGEMQMMQIEGGIEIPAGGAVELKPGGDHIMLMGLQQPLQQGLQLPLKLTFEKAGSITIGVQVARPKMDKMGDGKKMDHGKMDHGKMKHGN